MKHTPRVGPWTINTMNVVFENPWVRVIDHKVTHPNGAPGEYGVIRFSNIAVGILPFDQDGLVPLVGQHRFPSDKYSWELPEGGGPLNVPSIESARRELLEETGMRANCWAPLCAFDVSNSVTDEKAECFFAWDVESEASAPEDSEELTIKKVTFKTLLDSVMSGEISDSLTVIMTLKAYVKALHGQAPAPISGHILAETPAI